MIIKNLSLETLDQVVAVALRRDNFNLYKELYLESPEWNPTKRWDQGGPIIEYASIALDSPATPGDGEWFAICDTKLKHFAGDTALEAAMRAYAASIFGEMVQHEVLG
jgi:hypothetical protein